MDFEFRNTILKIQRNAYIKHVRYTRPSPILHQQTETCDLPYSGMLRSVHW
jgi:hypothetical protein